MKKYDKIIKKYCGKYALPPPLVRSIIKVESSGNQYAIRHEKNFKWLYKPENFASGILTLNTEKNSQKISWGLMQLMGATARELGFEGVYLSELLKPEINIKYGCKYLSGLRKRFSENPESECNFVDDISIFDDNMIAAYNAGSPRRKENGDYVNQEYVDKILQNWK